MSLTYPVHTIPAKNWKSLSGKIPSSNKPELKKLLFKAGLSQHLLAEQLGIKEPYVSMFINGHGYIPRKDWQKIHEYFLELRVTSDVSNNLF